MWGFEWTETEVWETIEENKERKGERKCGRKEKEQGRQKGREKLEMKDKRNVLIWEIKLKDWGKEISRK